MRLHSAFGLCTILFVLDACDPGTSGAEGDAALEFREDVPLHVPAQPVSFKLKGCEPYYLGHPGVTPDRAPAEWRSMIDTQARMVGGETLVAAFLADPENQELCEAACVEHGSVWTGESRTADISYDLGPTSIVGECPFDTLATETPMEIGGEILCACEG